MVLLCALFYMVAAPAQDGSFCNLARNPDAVLVITDNGTNELVGAGGKEWRGSGVIVRTRARREGSDVELLAPDAAVKHLKLQWKTALPVDWKYLGDAWERAYGDLDWKPLDPERVMPWYFLATNGKLTHGYGVKTGPAALCYWKTDTTGITLHADVRCGGLGVRLARRKLKVCTVLSRCGRAGETPFAATQAFCEQMCPKPRLPKQPVYGFNDWYCSYGHDTAEEFLKNTTYGIVHE